jgi:hypothetical protein
MRKTLAREAVFLLWRAAAKIDLGHTLQVAKTLTRVAQANDATVQVDVARPLAQRLNDWSEPVQIAFADTPNGWQMYVRPCEQQVAIAETIRARAARQ